MITASWVSLLRHIDRQYSDRFYLNSTFQRSKIKQLRCLFDLWCVFVKVPVLRPMDLLVEASPRRVFSNAHAYHINSISINSDCETYLSADDLRINLWNLNITDRSFSILLSQLSECVCVCLGIALLLSDMFGSQYNEENILGLV